MPGVCALLQALPRFEGALEAPLTVGATASTTAGYAAMKYPYFATMYVPLVCLTICLYLAGLQMHESDVNVKIELSLHGLFCPNRAVQGLVIMNMYANLSPFHFWWALPLVSSALTKGLSV